MKTYDEMYQSVLSKYDEYLEKKKKRNRFIKRTVPVLACLCLTMVFGIGYWDNLKNLPHHPEQSGIIEETTIETPDTTTATEVTNNNTTIKTNAHTVPVTTTVSVKNTVSERVTSTENKHTQTVTSVVSETESSIKTESSANKSTETQATATTSPVIQTTINSEQQTTTPVQTTEEPPVTTININIDDVLVGYYSANYSKPLPSARIALKCKAFCYQGEKIEVDVAMGDGSFHPQDYDSNRIYEYSIFPTDNYTQIIDENLIVNDEIGNYKKEYVGDEMQVFDIDGEYAEYDSYSHETAVIDLKNYKVGSSGCITFSFKTIFTNNPENPSTSGMMQNMYFYVGEKGIAISSLGVEEAIEEYQNISSLF